MDFFRTGMAPPPSKGHASMAVLLEHLNVIVPIERIRRSAYPRGFEGLMEDRAVELGFTLWHDHHLLREGAHSPYEVESIVDFWKSHGLLSTRRIRGALAWNDLCVVDAGAAALSLPCEWLEVVPSESYAFLRGQPRGPIIGK